MEDRELVPAEPSNEVDLANAVAQPSGSHHQHFVARGVSVAVIDLFEVVEIYDHQRQVTGGGADPAQRILQSFVEHRPVGQAGQWVVKGLVSQFGGEKVTLAKRLVQFLHLGVHFVKKTGVVGERDQLPADDQGGAGDRAGDDYPHVRVEAELREHPHQQQVGGGDRGVRQGGEPAAYTGLQDVRVGANLTL